MKEKDYFFGSLSTEVQTRLTAYQKTELAISALPSVHAGHRVRDPWLKHWVLDIAVKMRQHGVSVKRIIREIVQVLSLAGHAELVTEDQVRHIIREARRKDLEFAALFQPQGRRTAPKSRR
jgi:hypothetical protein